MASITVRITQPSPNALVGHTFTARVRVAARGTGRETVKDITARVNIGGTTHEFELDTSQETISFPVTLPPDTVLAEDGTLLIDASAQGTVFIVDPVEDGGMVFGSNSLRIRPDLSPPIVIPDILSVDATTAFLPFLLIFSGSAKDKASGVVEVLYQLDDAAFDRLTPVNPDWSRWEKNFNLDEGEHHIRVKAVDRFGNWSTPTDTVIIVRRVRRD